MEVSFLISFLAGVATFFSPCVLPIIPGYLSILSGGDKSKVIRRVLFFALGLALTFTSLGVAIAWVGSQVILLRETLIKILGVILVIYGIHFVKPLPFGILGREFGIKLPKAESSDLGALLLGGVFGLAWTPCSGVVLGVILSQALFFESLSAAVLLFSYSVGLILPMLLLAFFYQKSGQFIKLPPKVARYYLPVVGIIIIILGLSLMTGWIDYWRGNLLQIFPNLESGLLPLAR